MQKELLHYLEDCHFRGLSEKTIKGYREGLTRFCTWLGEREFNLSSVSGYQICLQKTYAPSSLHAEMRIIKAFITFLEEKEYVSENWGVRISMPKLKRKIEFIPRQDKALEAILAGTEPGPGDNSRNIKIKMEMREAMTFILFTGLRQIEIDRLRLSDFDLDNGEFVVLSKGENEDKLPLPRFLFDLVKQKIEENPKKMFSVTQAGMNHALKRGCIAIGITPISVHKLRKVYGTTLVRNHANPVLISRLMRHRNFQITYENYLRNDIEDMAVAANTGQDLGREMMSKDEIAEQINLFIKRMNLKKNFAVKDVVTKDSNGKLVLEIEWH